MRHILAIVVLLALSSGAAAQAPAPVRLHVFTQADPSGLVDKPTSERLKAVADMKKRLARLKTVQLVERADGAQATIEVMSAGWEIDGGRSATVAAPVGSATVITGGNPTESLNARATLRSGTFTTDFEASVGPFMRTFGENLARKAEDWLKVNIDALRKIGN